jgi:plasmid stabilization system protein ParE
MTALGVLSLCAARGVKLVLEGGDHITLEGPQAARDEVREVVRAIKPEVVTLLRDGRRAEVSTGFAQAFARLGNLYDGDLVGSLWARITTEHPALGHAIDTAEQAADVAAVAYQSGDAPDAGPFLACLASWERAWAEAIAAVTPHACSDCGRTDATVMVTTDTGRFCRRCLRPVPLNRKAPHA